MDINQVYLGDSLEVLKSLPDNSIDSCVTDPPYGIRFMNRKWDYNVPSVELWQELLGVLKPGGHALVACGTRTQHRMAVNLEDAGFEIRDIISWLYGSGFPKSHNIEKATQNERWEGWGTALKPAQELFTLVRKPPSESSIAKNVLRWGTGGINVDGCRVDTSDNSVGKGRFPANLIHDGSNEIVEMFPESKGDSPNRIPRGSTNRKKYGRIFSLGLKRPLAPECTRTDSGSASRFFYCAKASPKERGMANNHPTVKPIKLMEYLVRLITPPNGICIDPFIGSGTTAIACMNEGKFYIGIEKEEEYYAIALQRIEQAKSEAKHTVLF